MTQQRTRSDQTGAVVLVHTSDLHADDDLVGRRYTGLVESRSVLAKA